MGPLLNSYQLGARTTRPPTWRPTPEKAQRLPCAMAAAQHILRTRNNYLGAQPPLCNCWKMRKIFKRLTEGARSKFAPDGGGDLRRREGVLQGDAELSGFVDDIEEARMLHRVADL